jgi:hypothetical protein
LLIRASSKPNTGIQGARARGKMAIAQKKTRPQ